MSSLPPPPGSQPHSSFSQPAPSYTPQRTMRSESIPVWLHIVSWLIIGAEILSFFQSDGLSSGYSLEMLALVVLMIVSMYTGFKIWMIPLVILNIADDLTEFFQSLTAMSTLGIFGLAGGTAVSIATYLIYFVGDGFMLYGWIRYNRK